MIRQQSHSDNAFGADTGELPSVFWLGKMSFDDVPRQDRWRSHEFQPESHLAMDDLFPVNVLSRFLHVAVAIVLVGGTVFMRFILMPAAKEMPEAEHDQLRQRLLARWKRVVHGGIAVLFLSGLYNYIQQRPIHKGDSLYHALLGTKFLLAIVVFFIASALVGRSKTFETLRQNRAKWMGVVVLLSALIVGISGFVKVRGPKVKSVEHSQARQVEKQSAARNEFFPRSL